MVFDTNNGEVADRCLVSMTALVLDINMAGAVAGQLDQVRSSAVAVLFSF